MINSRSLALLLLSRFAFGAVAPTAPGPGEVFAAGSKCSVSWTPDESGEWKSFSIDLMSGSNSNMTLVANVAKDLDGTDPSLSPYTWTCPEVDPYSTVYFYQFNAADNKSNPTWTTRFTIASSAGETTAPPHSKQPNGDSIPWGVGALRSGSSVASREKHYSSSSDEEEDSDESSSSGDSEDTSQRSSSSKAKGGSDDDEETPTTGTSSSKGGSAKSSEDSEDSEVSEDDETTSSTKSGSSKSTLKDAEEDSKVSDTTTSKNSGTQGGNGSVTDAEAEESELEVPVSTSSRLKTVHSKPTSTPLPTGNINAVTPTLPLPSSPPSSAQPVGCAGGINATSSYCSPSSTANYATYASKLDLRSFLVVVSVCLYGLL